MCMLVALSSTPALSVSILTPVLELHRFSPMIPGRDDPSEPPGKHATMLGRLDVNLGSSFSHWRNWKAREALLVRFCALPPREG